MKIYPDRMTLRHPIGEIPHPEGYVFGYIVLLALAAEVTSASRPTVLFLLPPISIMKPLTIHDFI